MMHRQPTTSHQRPLGESCAVIDDFPPDLSRRLASWYRRGSVSKQWPTIAPDFPDFRHDIATRAGFFRPHKGTDMMLAFIFVGGIVLFIGAQQVLRRLGFAFASYKPELHYMRGPGPKWREKHAGAIRGRS
jgi:hypothetical protein